MLEVSIEEIKHLLGLRFAWTKVAQLVGISRSALYRRLEQEDIGTTGAYSDISNDELDRAVEYIKLSHPNNGESLLIGHLYIV